MAAADELARAEGVAAPRIGVCGLNPHAGEGGLIGTEEVDTIDPLLDELRRRYPGLSRCQPADTLFGRQLRGEFDEMCIRDRVAGYGAYLHGEAVAVGLCAAARLSRGLGMIGEPDVARVESAVASHALPTRVRRPLAIADLASAMARDKKARGGSPRFVLLRSLGDARCV